MNIISKNMCPLYTSCFKNVEIHSKIILNHIYFYISVSLARYIFIFFVSIFFLLNNQMLPL